MSSKAGPMSMIFAAFFSLPWAARTWMMLNFWMVFMGIIVYTNGNEAALIWVVAPPLLMLVSILFLMQITKKTT